MKRQFNDWRREGTRDPRCRNSEDDGIKQLSLSNIEKFNGNFPTFQMPKNVGNYSLDIERNYLNDFSQLRYLSFPPDSQEAEGMWKVGFDLAKGLNEVVEKDDAAVRSKMLDDMLTWILQERAAGNVSIVDPQKPLRPLEIEFVCFRGLLTLILSSPYENQLGWTISATRFQNTIYLWQLKNQESNNFSKNPRMQEMSIWGCKFEQYLCADTPTTEPNPEEPLNTNAEFCCLLKTRLAGYSLLYGAEVDAVRKEYQPPFHNLEGFVELKTNRHIETERQNTNFKRFKSMKWWAQSFLVGIPTIVCGYRDDDGYVTRLEEVDVKQLRKACDDYWKANICMNFCQQFLEFVKDTIPEGKLHHPEAHFIFEFDPKRRAVFVRKENGEMMRNLLPTWYMDSLQNPVVVPSPEFSPL